MALSDEVAAHVLGELHTLTKNIDAASERAEGLIKKLSALDQQLMQTCAEIEAATAAAEKASKATIAAVVAQGKEDIEAHTKEMLSAVASQINIAAQATVKAAIGNLAESVQAEIKNGIGKSAGDFKTTFDSGIAAVKKASIDYDKSLQRSVENHAPMGFGWQLFNTFLAGVIGAIFTGLLIVYLFASGTITMPSVEQQPAQKHVQK